MEDQTKKCPKCKEDIKIDATLCRYCGTPIAISEENKGAQGCLGCLGWIIIIVVIMAIASLFGDEKTKNNADNQETTQKNESNIPQQTAEEKKLELKKRLAKETESIKNFNGNDYRDSIEKINLEIILFSTWASLSTDAKNNPDSEIKKLSEDFELKLSQLQTKEFPQMRLAYGKLVGNTMWEHDVYVTVFGSGNSTIEFVGGIFAANKNIKDSQAILQDVLKRLRFDRVNYKWIKHDQEYTYFDMDSPKDSEIVDMIKQY